MKIWLITLGPLLAIFGASLAQAQDTIDVGKITCEQFITSQIIDSRTLSVWLSGYYNGTQKNTVIHPSAVRKSEFTMVNYCVSHPDTILMDAVKNGQCNDC
jgi:HdeA/HdeB family